MHLEALSILEGGVFSQMASLLFPGLAGTNLPIV